MVSQTGDEHRPRPSRLPAIGLCHAPFGQCKLRRNSWIPNPEPAYFGFSRALACRAAETVSDRVLASPPPATHGNGVRAGSLR